MTEPLQTKREDGGVAASSRLLSEKQRRELWIYICVSIVAVEILIAVGSLFFAFINNSQSMGGDVFTFPWLVWGSFSIIVPTFILLLVHSANVGLFRPPSGKAESEKEWQRLLPQRLQRIYAIIKGAPAVVVLVGVIALGGALLTLDGAISALSRLGGVLVPYIPHIAIGLAVVLCVFIGAVAWLNFRTRRLIAEYDFRREVLEKTGVIIVDKGSTPLPPGGGSEDVPYAIVAGEEAAAMALPPPAPKPQNDPSA